MLAIVDAVRGAVGSDFPIGIKLNSSDFQRGGFTNAECIELVRRLNDSRLDLLELSGGSLEQPKLVGVSVKDEGEVAAISGWQPTNFTGVEINELCFPSVLDARSSFAASSWTPG